MPRSAHWDNISITSSLDPPRREISETSKESPGFIWSMISFTRRSRHAFRPEQISSTNRIAPRLRSSANRRISRFWLSLSWPSVETRKYAHAWPFSLGSFFPVLDVILLPPFGLLGENLYFAIYLIIKL